MFAVGSRVQNENYTDAVGKQSDVFLFVVTNTSGHTPVFSSVNSSPVYVPCARKYHIDRIAFSRRRVTSRDGVSTDGNRRSSVRRRRPRGIRCN